jgi:hypothetical protein
MRSSTFTSAFLSLATVTFIGCKKPPQQCALGDSPAVCQAAQACFKSDTSLEVCREAERDANSVDANKSLAPAHSGEANALDYDSSKASQQQQKHAKP